MRIEEAFRNLEVVGWVFVGIGFLGLCGSLAYWSKQTAIEVVMNLVFATAFLVVGYLVESSTNAIKRRSKS